MNWWDSLRRINFLQFSYRELTETEEPRKRIQSCNCVQPREDQTAWMRIYTAKNTANQDRPHTSEWPPEITGSPRWSLAPEIRIYTPRHKRPRCFVGHGQPGKRIERASEQVNEWATGRGAHRLLDLVLDDVEGILRGGHPVPPSSRREPGEGELGRIAGAGSDAATSSGSAHSGVASRTKRAETKIGEMSTHTNSWAGLRSSLLGFRPMWSIGP